jgi:hypothetical protein
MSQPHPPLQEIFQAQIQTLALTLRPATVSEYRQVARHFLGFLRHAFPQVRRLSQLRRDPHLLAWFRRLCQQDPLLCNTKRPGVGSSGSISDFSRSPPNSITSSRPKNEERLAGQ